LRGDKESPFREAVGHSSSDEGKEEDGREVCRAHDAEPDRLVRELVDEPPLRGIRHPSSDERDELAEPKEPEVPVAEGTEVGRESFGAVGLWGGRVWGRGPGWRNGGRPRGAGRPRAGGAGGGGPGGGGRGPGWRNGGPFATCSLGTCRACRIPLVGLHGG